MCVGLRHRQGEQRPRGLGTHRRQIAQVNGEGLVTDRFRRRVGQEVPPLNQRIGRRCQSLARGNLEQRGIVAEHRAERRAAQAGGRSTARSARTRRAS
jgi:hypothetical protein